MPDAAKKDRSQRLGSPRLIISTLKNLLKEITRANLHKETDFGGRAGNEVW